MSEQSRAEIGAAAAELGKTILALESILSADPNDDLANVIYELRWQFIRLSILEIGEENVKQAQHVTQ